MSAGYSQHKAPTRGAERRSADESDSEGGGHGEGPSAAGTAQEAGGDEDMGQQEEELEAVVMEIMETKEGKDPRLYAASMALCKALGADPKALVENAPDESDVPGRKGAYSHTMEWAPRALHQEAAERALLRVDSLQQSTRVQNAKKVGTDGKGVIMDLLVEGKWCQIMIYEYGNDRSMAGLGKVEAEDVASKEYEVGGGVEWEARGDEIIKVTVRSVAGMPTKNKPKEQARAIKELDVAVAAMLRDAGAVAATPMLTRPTKLLAASAETPLAMEAARVVCTAETRPLMIPRVDGKVMVRLPKFSRGKETTYVEREITEAGAVVRIAGMHICQEGLVPDHEEGKKCWYSLKGGFRPKGGQRAQEAHAKLEAYLIGKYGRADACPAESTMSLRRWKKPGDTLRRCTRVGGCKQTLLSCQTEEEGMPEEVERMLMEIGRLKQEEKRAEWRAKDAADRAQWEAQVAGRGLEAELPWGSEGARARPPPQTPPEERKRHMLCDECGGQTVRREDPGGRVYYCEPCYDAYDAACGTVGERPQLRLRQRDTLADEFGGLHAVAEEQQEGTAGESSDAPQQPSTQEGGAQEDGETAAMAEAEQEDGGNGEQPEPGELQEPAAGMEPAGPVLTDEDLLDYETRARRRKSWRRSGQR